MRKISFEEVRAAVEMLRARAERWLPPEVGMMIECASETEPSPERRELLLKLYDDFIDAGLNRRSLGMDTVRYLVFASIGRDAELDGFALGNAVREGIRGEYELCEMQSDAGGLRLTVLPVGADFEEQCSVSPAGEFRSGAEIALYAARDARPDGPFIAGIGLADTAGGARAASRLALSRPIDMSNPDAGIADMERDVKKRFNSRVSGYARAMAVLVENRSTAAAPAYCAVQISGCLLRRASVSFS